MGHGGACKLRESAKMANNTPFFHFRYLLSTSPAQSLTCILFLTPSLESRQDHYFRAFTRKKLDARVANKAKAHGPMSLTYRGTVDLSGPL